VPYDPHTAFLFHGEEFSRGARLWTSGYDFYSPSENLVFHHYNRKVRRPDTEGGERWNKGYKVSRGSPGADVGRGEPSPGADVGRGEPSLGADVAAVSAVSVQMWQR
jgi:hypothetical protein